MNTIMQKIGIALGIIVIWVLVTVLLKSIGVIQCSLWWALLPLWGVPAIAALFFFSVFCFVLCAFTCAIWATTLGRA